MKILSEISVFLRLMVIAFNNERNERSQFSILESWYEFQTCHSWNNKHEEGSLYSIWLNGQIYWKNRELHGGPSMNSNIMPFEAFNNIWISCHEVYLKSAITYSILITLRKNNIKNIITYLILRPNGLIAH